MACNCYPEGFQGTAAVLSLVALGLSVLLLLTCLMEPQALWMGTALGKTAILQHGPTHHSWPEASLWGCW